MKTMRVIVSILVFTVFSAAVAQRSVVPPPKPANDAPANAEVLKLLRAGMSESVVLNKIRATTDKFDTSADALVALKQAGANDAELNAVLAQGPAPGGPQPGAAPSATGPSPAETMQFIQDKLNDQGKVAYVQFNQNAIDGSTPTTNAINEISNVVADPNQCIISYHRKVTNNGQIAKDENCVFSLRDVQDIVVKPYEQYQNEWNSRNGYQNWIVTSTSPAITALVAHRPHGEENFFSFTDANLADRVAKAMVHAVELCGGGNKDKF
jgi:hypothetical protein